MHLRRERILLGRGGGNRREFLFGPTVVDSGQKMGKHPFFSHLAGVNYRSHPKKAKTAWFHGGKHTNLAHSSERQQGFSELWANGSTVL